jgi:hypothetical protein
MECDVRQRLQEEWLAEHDRLCLALDEYERKLAMLEQFDQGNAIASRTSTACDRARDMLDDHEREHCCVSPS